MKNIVFFNSSNEAGGPARVISLWANFFTKNGYKIEIVSNLKTVPFFILNDQIKLSFLGIEKFRQKNKFKTLLKLYRFISPRRSQFLIFNKAIYIPYLFCLKKLGLIDNSLKLIYFIHGGSSDLKIYYNNFKTFMIHNTFHKVIASHDDYENYNLHIKKTFRRKILDTIFFIDSNQSIIKKTTYIPNPISFSISNEEIKEERIILSVGRLDHIKGFDILIKAWGRIFKKHSDWKMLIVGSGAEKERLNNLILDNAIKNVELIAEQNCIENFYKKSSIYVMSSREEGFPMVLLEAMASSLPIISFANEGAKAIIDDKKTGILVKLLDEKKLSIAITKLIEDKELRKRIAHNAYLKAKSYDINNIRQKWDKVLNI